MMGELVQDRAVEQPVESRADADSVAPQILALTGSDRETIQTLLCRAAQEFRAAGYHVVGVVEEIVPGGSDVLLRDLVSGASHKLTQDLGPGSAGCSLDPAGLAAACAGVEEAISALQGGTGGKATVVILSKFGRQEADGRGLTHAFHAAVAAELPILTSVSPVVVKAWEGFAGELSAFAPVLPEPIVHWRERISAASPAALAG